MLPYKTKIRKNESFNTSSPSTPSLIELSLILELKPTSSDNFLLHLKQKHKIKYQKPNKNQNDTKIIKQNIPQQNPLTHHHHQQFQQTLNHEYSFHNQQHL